MNPEKFTHVKKDDAQAFIDWILSPEGQKVGGEHRGGRFAVGDPARGGIVDALRLSQFV